MFYPQGFDKNQINKYCFIRYSIITSITDTYGRFSIVSFVK